MKLGKTAHIVRGVEDHDATIEFYHDLGYKTLESGTSSTGTKFTLFTDGVINLLISEDQSVYTGLIYFDDDQTERVEELEDDDYHFVVKNEDNGRIASAMFEAIPNILGINLVSTSYDKKYIPPMEPMTSFGTFGEFSIGTDNFDKTVDFLTPLGYEILHRSDKPYNWGILFDNHIPLGIHQTPEIENIALTYFSKNIENIIRQVKKIGIEVKKVEGLGSNSGIVTAPDGLDINLFYTDQEIEWRNISG